MWPKNLLLEKRGVGIVMGRAIYIQGVDDVHHYMHCISTHHTTLYPQLTNQTKQTNKKQTTQMQVIQRSFTTNWSQPGSKVWRNPWES